MHEIIDTDITAINKNAFFMLTIYFNSTTTKNIFKISKTSLNLWRFYFSRLFRSFLNLKSQNFFTSSSFFRISKNKFYLN